MCLTLRRLQIPPAFGSEVLRFYEFYGQVMGFTLSVRGFGLWFRGTPEPEPYNLELSNPTNLIADPYKP